MVLGGACDPWVASEDTPLCGRGDVPLRGDGALETHGDVPLEIHDDVPSEVRGDDDGLTRAHGVQAHVGDEIAPRQAHVDILRVQLHDGDARLVDAPL